MVTLYDTGIYLLGKREIIKDDSAAAATIKRRTGKDVTKEQAKKGTMAYSILRRHNSGGDEATLRITYDTLTAHDITYVGIIQTARASGMKEFPVPFVMTNCHNSLCAVGGTINQDDHMFALSAAKKYGGIYVPANLSVIHAYNREMMSKCGRMILGSDSHTRYGALGTMGVGEGGGELVKQLLGKTYDFRRPPVIAVYLTGKPQPGIGPQDVALSIIGKVYKNGYVKNSVMEFVGDGIGNLDIDFRNGIDVMTTETACWSSIWCTDETVKEYYATHGREEDYEKMEPADVAYYDGLVHVDLSTVKPTIAMPFHPSNIYAIEELKAHPREILEKVQEEGQKQIDNPKVHLNLTSKIVNGEIHVDQGIVAGCSGGTFANLVAVADIMRGKSIGNGSFEMSVYPASQPVYAELVRNGTIATLMDAGVVMRSAFCGPCFGAGDTPSNQGFSVRHTTRNFPNREGSKPNEGQIASVALMDARSVAATAINGGKLTAATEIDAHYGAKKYFFNQQIYEKRVFNAWKHADPSSELRFGPNIKDWPDIPSLTDDLLLKIVTYIDDPVTTTDELIPSGETSSYRSNPLRLAEFTLGRRDPTYVGRAKKVHERELDREKGNDPETGDEELRTVYDKVRSIRGFEHIDPLKVGIGSTIYANKPGDGSAREQAASCQRVLGAWANLAKEYATKRYRSNLINWGMIPLLVKDGSIFKKDDYVFIPGIRKAIEAGRSVIDAYVIGDDVREFSLSTGDLTEEERNILTAGCIINHYRS